MRHCLRVVYLCALLGASASASANVLRNPSFEEIPGPMSGQGFMPSDWLVLAITPDTYSNDGSYGLLPLAFGNFTGVVAFDGIRWVAAWEFAGEQFGQLLSSPLSPGLRYQLSGRLHQSVRNDLNFPGGYRVLLSNAAGTDRVEVASIGPTVGSGDWEAFSVTFEAPADASARPLLIFDPFAASGSAYPGLDDLSLVGAPVPVPALPPLASVALTAALLVSCAASRGSRAKLA